jgi:threonine/homoserine/homoserine lactone efflux protein
VDRLVALIGYAFVSTVTPGPNNVLLWTSGAAFGLRRTVPHIVGTAVGVGLMALAVAAGLGALVTAVPAIGVGMKLAGSAYLVYLAVQILRMRGARATEIARPLGVVGAAAFQVINPKAWIFALVAMTTFRPADLPVVGGSLLVAATMASVIVPTAALWAAAGGPINRLMAEERTRRIVAWSLAALVVATAVSVWLD